MSQKHLLQMALPPVKNHQIAVMPTGQGVRRQGLQSSTGGVAKLTTAALRLGKTREFGLLLVISPIT
jgi:hypothetical protein